MYNSVSRIIQKLNISCSTVRNHYYRLYSSLSQGEQRLYDVVKKNFPQAVSIKVEDISGGCGAMYDVFVESSEFKGKRLVQQHMLVNQALKSEIKEMHGIRIHTCIPSDE